MLTEAELERLAILSEECGEVVQVIGKIIRYGYDSYNPLDESKITNKELLENELGDLFFMMNFCDLNKDIDIEKIFKSSLKKKKKV